MRWKKAIYNISTPATRTAITPFLYRALEQGDMDTYRHIRDDLMNSMGVDGASIDSVMRSRYNKAVEKDPDYTLPQRARDLIGSRDKYVPLSRRRRNLWRGRPGGAAPTRHTPTSGPTTTAAWPTTWRAAPSSGEWTTRPATRCSRRPMIPDRAVGVEPWEYVLVPCGLKQ